MSTPEDPSPTTNFDEQDKLLMETLATAHFDFGESTTPPERNNALDTLTKLLQARIDLYKNRKS
jgi:hypothetical protein